MNTTFRTKMQAVTICLNGGTLKETAARYGIHRTTLTRWKKWYKEGGAENIGKHSYKRPWNRFSKRIEKKVMLLKENNPSLTIRKAKEILAKEHIFVSLKGIHCIWRRFNLVKRSPTDPLSPHAPFTLESKCMIERAKNLLANKQSSYAVREAARILNSLTSYPADEKDILKEIPEQFLSPRRQLDRLFLSALEMPAPEFLEKAKGIRESLEKDGYFYSATIAGLLETLALNWMKTPEDVLTLTATLKKRTNGIYDPVLRFQLANARAMAYAHLLQEKNAFEAAKQCRRMLGSKSCPSSLEYYGVLMTSLTDYRKSLQFHQMALEKETDEDNRNRLLSRIGFAYMMMGKYREAEKFLTNKFRVKHQGRARISFLATQANMYYALGEFEKSSKCLAELLEESRKEHLRNSIYSASLCLASITAALGKIKESKIILRSYLPLLKKYKLKRETTTIEFLIKKRLLERKARTAPHINHIHLLHLLYRAWKTLRIRDYQRTLNFAKRKGLVNFLHRLIVFFPEIIIELLQNGQSTGLPISILRFPVFNISYPIYHIKFLGDIRCYTNQTKIAAKLPTKQKAFLIHIALRMGEPGKSISISDLYNNFWPQSKTPSRRLARMLVLLRHQLLIPGHLLCISRRANRQRLTNRGIYITTDYADFTINLMQARAMKRAMELKVAREQYLQAFKLIQGEPFLSMYDNWSEEIRSIIFNQLENATLEFTELCRESGDGKNAQKTLNKIYKFIPS